MDYLDFPFTYQGYNFISRLAKSSPFILSVAQIGMDEFSKINQQALADLLPAKNYTLSEIEKVLDRVNNGATHAWILLGENN